MTDKVVTKKAKPHMAIVLNADTNYAEQVITLIKSISYHHQNVKFYLLNRTFSAKWIELLNEQLAPLNNVIIDTQTFGDYAQFKTLEYVTEATFYRFNVSDLPEDKVIYLDSDIVVDRPLDKLYATRLGDNLLAAIPDMVLDHSAFNHHYLEYPDMKPYFNAGVLLINAKLWRAENVKQGLYEHLGRLPGVIYADQDILNIYMKGRWKALPKAYNYQTAARFAFQERNLEHLVSEVESLGRTKPTIIHYTSKAKPWSRGADQLDTLYHDRYWFYYSLTWEAIYKKHSEI